MSTDDAVNFLHEITHASVVHSTWSGTPDRACKESSLPCLPARSKGGMSLAWTTLLIGRHRQFAPPVPLTENGLPFASCPGRLRLAPTAAEDPGPRCGASVLCASIQVPERSQSSPPPGERV